MFHTKSFNLKNPISQPLHVAKNPSELNGITNGFSTVIVVYIFEF